MIIKATIVSNASADASGQNRVKLEAPRIWENSAETADLYASVGALPLNIGDKVFVLIDDMDFSNPLILGKCWDNNFSTNGGIEKGFAVLWESVSSDGSHWTVAYTRGDEFYIENDAGMVLSISGGNIQIHDGKNGGLLNVAQFNTFVQAVMSDLAVLGSGSSVSRWLAGDGQKIEDLTVTH